ncbi:zinc finger protein 25-like [Uranotaenia lowii]|uniref:zinc finger protein 25-like n=1 Tax=Uranotaenia lowii TaxID=190385 RepID=UPI002479C986|nr:zinc finger protein 25-like [Uranotaenia lowii]
MATENTRSLQKNSVALEPLFAEVVVKQEPDDCPSTYLSESDKLPSNEQKKLPILTETISRHVQVDSDDLDRHSTKPEDGWQMDKDVEPIFLTGNVVNDSQCRFCLRKLDKSHLKMIDRSLKTRLRRAFKINIQLYCAYTFACVNCTNLIHAFSDFRDTIEKSKKILTQEILYVLEDDTWVKPDNLAAAAKCRDMVSQHCERIEEIYAVYERKLKEAVDLQHRTVQTLYDAGVVEGQTETFVDHGGEEFEHLNQTEADFEQKLQLEIEIFKQEIVEPEEEENKLTSNIYQDLNVASNFKAELYEYETSNTTFIPEKQGKCSEPKTNAFGESVSKLVQYNSPKSPEGRNETEPLEHISKSDLKDSSKTHIVCPICRITVRMAILEGHMNQHNGVQPYKCSFEGCDKTFYGKYHRSRHIRRKHGGKSKNEMNMHTFGYKVMENSKKHVLCPICEKTVHITTAEGHMNQHNGIKPYKCPFEGCDKAFYGRNTKSLHIHRMHGNNGEALTFKCEICGKLIKGPINALNVHLYRHKVKDIKDKDKVKEKDRAKEKDRDKEKDRVKEKAEVKEKDKVKEKDQIKEKDKVKDKTNSRKNILCPICKKTFHKSTKEAHMNKHNGVQPHKCPFEGCGKAFYGRNQKSHHIHRMHGNNGEALTFKCGICGKSIRGPKDALNLHIARHKRTLKAT